MKAIKRIACLFALVSFCLMQSGCWDQKIYEDIGFILQTGLELNEEKQLLYTITVPIITTNVKGKVEVLSTTGNLLRESREDIRQTLGRQVEAGKVQHLFISEELAKAGAVQFMDAFIRSPENPVLANVLVVEGSPKELMEFSTEFKNKPLPAVYMNDLLVQARENGYAPEARVYDFIIKAYTDTIDICTPILTYNKESISVAGTALFDNNKMVGKIDTSKTIMLYMLLGKGADLQYIYLEPNSSEVIKKGTVTIIKDIKKKVDIYTEGDTLKIDIKLNLKAGITEYTGQGQLDRREDLEGLEAEVSKAIEKDCLQLLKHLQEINSDPIGFGEMLRSKHNAYWKSIKWEDAYKDMVFNVDAKLKFEFYGAVN